MELFQLKQVLFVVEMVLVSLQTIAIAQLDILEVFVTFTHAMENYPMILQLATLVETVSEKNNVSATMDTLEHIVTWIFAMEKYPTIQLFVVHVEHAHHQTTAFVHLVTWEQIVLLSLVLIEILVLLKEPALVQTIAPAIPNMQDQTALSLFAMEKVQSPLEFVLETVIAFLQIIVLVYPMDIRVHFAMLQFVLLLGIVLEMVYVLVPTIALVSVDGKIQIAVHSTVLL
jgi:hypothetical protein